MKKSKSLRKNSLRVWHIPQVPGKPFHVEVKSIEEAARMLRALANYDLFQYENKIKPDYANAQGLEVFDGTGWSEWYSQEGLDVHEYMEAHRE